MKTATALPIGAAIGIARNMDAVHVVSAVEHTTDGNVLVGVGVATVLGEIRPGETRLSKTSARVLLRLTPAERDDLVARLLGSEGQR